MPTAPMTATLPIRMRYMWLFVGLAHFVLWATPLLGQSYTATRIAAWLCCQAWRMVRAEIKVKGKWHRLPLSAPDFEVAQC